MDSAKASDPAAARGDSHTIGPEAHAVIARVMAYPIGAIVDKYISDFHVRPDLAAEHERELKRYLALSILNDSSGYGMRGPVDDLWHTFILFTREYARFCAETAGCFIHHTPATDVDQQATSTARDPYDAMLRDYETVFGESPPGHIWPRGVDLRIRLSAARRAESV